MREIKFRVWDNINKNMRYDIAAIDFELNRISFKNLENRIASENYREFWDLPYELMQYTGLQDKNGREIYEGDIYHMGDHRITYTVVWHDTGLDGKQNGSSSYVGLSYWQDRIEVIDNVYENKNLLEEK